MQGGLVHQLEQRVVGQQQSLEFLPHQVGLLAAQHDALAAKVGLCSFEGRLDSSALVVQDFQLAGPSALGFQHARNQAEQRLGTLYPVQAALHHAHRHAPLACRRSHCGGRRFDAQVRAVTEAPLEGQGLVRLEFPDKIRTGRTGNVQQLVAEEIPIRQAEHAFPQVSHRHPRQVRLALGTRPRPRSEQQLHADCTSATKRSSGNAMRVRLAARRPPRWPPRLPLSGWCRPSPSLVFPSPPRRSSRQGFRLVFEANR